MDKQPDPQFIFTGKPLGWGQRPAPAQRWRAYYPDDRPDDPLFEVEHNGDWVDISFGTLTTTVPVDVDKRWPTDQPGGELADVVALAIVNTSEQVPQKAEVRRQIMAWRWEASLDRWREGLGDDGWALAVKHVDDNPLPSEVAFKLVKRSFMALPHGRGFTEGGGEDRFCWPLDVQRYIRRKAGLPSGDDDD